MAWRERNLFQKFDLLFPYRNLVTSILFFFFSLPRVTILTRTFPRTETFSINYIPLAAPSLRYLISYLSPRIRRTVFQTLRLANSHGRKKKKKKKNVYAPIGHPFDFEEKCYRTLLEFPLLSSAEQIFTGAWHDVWTFVTPFFFLFIFFFRGKVRP